MTAPARKRPFRKRDEELDRYINLKLAALGQPVSRNAAGSDFLEIAGPLLRNYYQKDRQLGNWLCASDSRIQDFLDAYLSDVCPQGAARLPANTFVLDREGMAPRPIVAGDFGFLLVAVPGLLPPAAGCAAQSAQRQADYAGTVSHRRGRVSGSGGQSRGAQAGLRGTVERGAASSRGSADATVHGGPEGEWRAASSRCCCGRWFVRPPALNRRRPWKSGLSRRAAWSAISISWRAFSATAAIRIFRKTMRGSMYRIGPDTPAASCWRRTSWGFRRRALGLPHVSEATERQRRDGMCWTDEAEPYNGGRAFKLVCRDARGVMVTVIADNYFGYCKKEVKTQISFAANLYGSCEEEHAGGALAFATYVLGQDFFADRTVSLKVAAFADAVNLLGDLIELQPDGHAVDKLYPNVYYVPEHASFHTREGFIRWPHGGRRVAAAFARRGGVLSAQRFPRQTAKAVGRHGVAPGGLAASRNAVPQALHGVRRRQIRDLQIDRRCPAERAGVRQGLPPRHGPGGGDPRPGFLRRSIATGRRTNARGGRF